MLFFLFLFLRQHKQVLGEKHEQWEDSCTWCCVWESGLWSVWLMRILTFRINCIVFVFTSVFCTISLSGDINANKNTLHENSNVFDPCLHFRIFYWTWCVVLQCHFSFVEYPLKLMLPIFGHCPNGGGGPN